MSSLHIEHEFKFGVSDVELGAKNDYELKTEFGDEIDAETKKTMILLPDFVYKYVTGTLSHSLINIASKFPKSIHIISEVTKNTLVMITTNDYFVNEQQIGLLRPYCLENAISQIIDLPREFYATIYHTSNIISEVRPNISLKLLCDNVSQWMNEYPICFFDKASKEELHDWSKRWGIFELRDFEYVIVLGSEFHGFNMREWSTQVPYCPDTHIPLIFRHVSHKFTCLCDNPSTKYQYEYGLKERRLGREGTIISSSRFGEEKKERHAISHRTMGGVVVVDGVQHGITAGHFLGGRETKVVAWSECFGDIVGDINMTATVVDNLWLDDNDAKDIALLDLSQSWHFTNTDLSVRVKEFALCNVGWNNFHPNVFIIGGRHEHCVTTYLSQGKRYLTDDEWDGFREVLISSNQVNSEDFKKGTICTFKRTSGDNNPLKNIKCQYIIRVENNIDVGGCSGALCFMESYLNWGVVGVQSGIVEYTRDRTYCFIQPLHEIPKIEYATLTSFGAQSIWLNYVESRLPSFNGVDMIVHKDYRDDIPNKDTKVKFYSNIPNGLAREDYVSISDLNAVFFKVWERMDSSYVERKPINNLKLSCSVDVFAAYYEEKNDCDVVDKIHIISALPGLYPPDTPTSISYNCHEVPVIVEFNFFHNM
jgi:hypothetical protein